MTPLQHLIDALPLDSPISIVDIGANPIDGEPPYRPLMETGIAHVTGFEPQHDALAELKRRQGPDETYLPNVVGPSYRTSLYVCVASGMTSLLEPNRETLKFFPQLKELGEVKTTIEVDPVPLCKFGQFDYVKIDSQGSEYEIFYDKNSLKGTLAVHTEVSFVPLYIGQQPFGRIDALLHGYGYLPLQFEAIKTWPIHERDKLRDKRKWQLLEADIAYARDFRYLYGHSDEELKKLALISYGVYGALGYTMLCLGELESRGLVDATKIGNYLS